MESLNKIFLEQIDNWKQLGQSLMTGLESGLRSGAAGVYAQAQAIANNVRQIIEEAMETDSPSKVFIGIGENIMKGWEIGLENRESNLYGTISGIASSFSDLRGGPQPAGVVASPQQAPSRLAPVNSASSVVNAEVNMGGQQINNGMDTVMLQIALEQALRNVLQ